MNIIDWKNWENNHFGIAEEVTLRGNKTRRPDIVLYVNGIALGVLELKRGTVDILKVSAKIYPTKKKSLTKPFLLPFNSFLQEITHKDYDTEPLKLRKNIICLGKKTGKTMKDIN